VCTLAPPSGRGACSRTGDRLTAQEPNHRGWPIDLGPRLCPGCPVHRYWPGGGRRVLTSELKKRLRRVPSPELQVSGELERGVIGQLSPP
jgi:hypothetical protein